MLEKIFGRSAVVKVVEAFLGEERRGRWMNLREVSRRSRVNPGTISRNIDILVENGILIEERPSRWIRIFRLNTENIYVPILIEFYESLLKANCRKGKAGRADAQGP